MYTGHGTLKHWREPKYIVVFDWLRLYVDQATDDVYFTDSSTTYPRRFNTEIMMNTDAMGRKTHGRRRSPCSGPACHTRTA